MKIKLGIYTVIHTFTLVGWRDCFCITFMLFMLNVGRPLRLVFRTYLLASPAAELIVLLSYPETTVEIWLVYAMGITFT